MVLLYFENPYTFMFLLKFLVAGISLLKPTPLDKEEPVCYSHLSDGMIIHACDCLSYLHVLEKCHRRTDTHFYSGVRIGEASNPGPAAAECAHPTCTTTCVHGLKCTIHGHMHAAGQLEGRKRRVAEQLGKKKKTKLRLTLCKRSLSAECGLEDHYHCSSSTCHHVRTIIGMILEKDYNEQKEYSFHDDDVSSSEDDDVPPPRLSAKKLAKLKDKADYIAIEEEGAINRAEDKASADARGMGLAPNILPPLKINPRQPVVSELNADCVPCPAGDEVTSIALKDFLEDPVDPTLVTKRVLLFVNCTVGKDYVPFSSRIRDYLLKNCPFTKTTTTVVANELNPRNTVAEAQAVMETKQDEVKFFWKTFDQPGDLLSSDSGEQNYFLQLYPGCYYGDVYVDIARDAMLDRQLLRAATINKNGDISESTLASITDWYGRKHINPGASVTVMTDTIVHIVNQLVARYAKLRSALTNNQELDFRTGGRARRTRASKRTPT